MHALSSTSAEESQFSSSRFCGATVWHVEREYGVTVNVFTGHRAAQ